MYVGTLCLRKRCRALSAGRACLVADEIRRQARLVRRCRADHHDGLAHSRMLLQHGFNLPQFQTEATYLHLGVEATVIFQGPVREIARQIAGSVETGSGLGLKGCGTNWQRSDQDGANSPASPLPRQHRVPQARQSVRAADAGQAHRPGGWQ